MRAKRSRRVTAARKALVGGLVTAAGLVTACGGGGAPTTAPTKEPATSSPTVAIPSPTAAPAGQAAVQLGAPTVVVTMSGEADDPADRGTFHPSQVTVATGQIVEWSYSATAFVPHNIVFDGQPSLSNSVGLGSKPSGSPGEATWQVRFSAPGTYSYKCTYHPGMVGTVTVTG